MLRYGTNDGDRPEGFQLDMEGAAFPRLSLEHGEDVVSTDYRVGFPFTYGWDQYQVKLGYIHICSHLGDEYMLANPDAVRINYVRNGFLLGGSYYCTKDLRVYAESSWAFEYDGGAKPWEFQFGAEYSPAGPTGFHPKPFFAVNGDIRQEVDFGGNVCVETGYQWRGAANHLFRAGVQILLGQERPVPVLQAIRREDRPGAVVRFLGGWGLGARPAVDASARPCECPAKRG